jgi:hypothetical protein
VRVPQRVAQQFAHHENGVVHDRGEHARCLEVGAEALTCDGDA